jgi:hypothetical protein
MQVHSLWMTSIHIMEKNSRPKWISRSAHQEPEAAGAVTFPFMACNGGHDAIYQQRPPSFLYIWRLCLRAHKNKRDSSWPLSLCFLSSFLYFERFWQKRRKRQEKATTVLIRFCFLYIVCKNLTSKKISQCIKSIESKNDEKEKKKINK